MQFDRQKPRYGFQSIAIGVCQQFENGDVVDIHTDCITDETLRAVIPNDTFSHATILRAAVRFGNLGECLMGLCDRNLSGSIFDKTLKGCTEFVA